MTLPLNMTTKSNKPTVVVVDDDDAIRAILETILYAGDFEIVGEATDGKAAVEACKLHRPEVVLLDINMPGVDGLTALRLIKKGLPATQVIMISGDSTMERVKEAVASGASGFIVKPFNAERVLDDITAVLNKKEVVKW